MSWEQKARPTLKIILITGNKRGLEAGKDVARRKEDVITERHMTRDIFRARGFAVKA